MQKLFSMIVVDDEPTILSGLCDLYPWNNWGFEVVGAYLTADSALEALHGSLTDVVLTDIRMPGMDGLSFASMLSRAFPATCVALMTILSIFAKQCAPASLSIWSSLCVMIRSFPLS